MGDSGPWPPIARGGAAGCVTDHVQGSDPRVEICKLTAKKGFSEYLPGSNFD